MGEGGDCVARPMCWVILPKGKGQLVASIQIVARSRRCRMFRLDFLGMPQGAIDTTLRIFTVPTRWEQLMGQGTNENGRESFVVSFPRTIFPRKIVAFGELCLRR